MTGREPGLRGTAAGKTRLFSGGLLIGQPAALRGGASTGLEEALPASEPLPASGARGGSEEEGAAAGCGALLSGGPVAFQLAGPSMPVDEACLVSRRTVAC